MADNNLSPELLLQIRKEAREQAVTFIDAYMKGKELEYKEKMLELQTRKLRMMDDMMINLRFIRNRLEDISENLEDNEGHNLTEVLREIDRGLIGCF